MNATVVRSAVVSAMRDQFITKPPSPVRERQLTNVARHRYAWAGETVNLQGGGQLREVPARRAVGRGSHGSMTAEKRGDIQDRQLRTLGVWRPVRMGWTFDAPFNHAW